jgi:hypothetical protein
MVGEKIMPKSISSLSTRKIEIPEDRYKSDFELHDRFQNFSAELLKLALSGIAVFGVFLSVLAGKDTDAVVRTAMQASFFKWLSAGALSAFGMSVLLALCHRFLASDGMYHHLRAIKLLILLEKPDEKLNRDTSGEAEKILSKVIDDERLRNTKFKWSEFFLKLSAVSLAVGSFFLAGAFFSIVL